jgi:hypothetical protein
MTTLPGAHPATAVGLKILTTLQRYTTMVLMSTAAPMTVPGIHKLGLDVQVTPPSTLGLTQTQPPSGTLLSLEKQPPPNLPPLFNQKK